MDLCPNIAYLMDKNITPTDWLTLYKRFYDLLSPEEQKDPEIIIEPEFDPENHILEFDRQYSDEQKIILKDLVLYVSIDTSKIMNVIQKVKSYSD